MLEARPYPKFILFFNLTVVYDPTNAFYRIFIELFFV